MNMWIYTIEPSLEIIQFEASETRGEYKVAYSEIIYVGFKLPKWPRRPVCAGYIYKRIFNKNLMKYCFKIKSFIKIHEALNYLTECIYND